MIKPVFKSGSLAPMFLHIEAPGRAALEAGESTCAVVRPGLLSQQAWCPQARATAQPRSLTWSSAGSPAHMLTEADTHTYR